MGIPMLKIRRWDRLIFNMGIPILVRRHLFIETDPSALFRYPTWRLIVRSRDVSKPRDLFLELYNRSENWQAPLQYCCRCACEISKPCNDLNYQSRAFEASRNLTIKNLIGYWNGAQVTSHERYRVANQWQRDFFTSLFRRTTKKISPRHWPLVKETTGDRWFPHKSPIMRRVPISRCRYRQRCEPTKMNKERRSLAQVTNTLGAISIRHRSDACLIDVRLFANSAWL